MGARLVRDRIGTVPWGDEAAKAFLRPTRDRDEHVNLLIRKGLEEFGEVITAHTDELVEELADMFEVLRTIAILNGFMMLDVEAAAALKRTRSGGFIEGLVWETPGDQ